MKSILMSIRPKWVEKIASGKKTVEVRKSVPKCGTPFKVYMYETRDGGHSCKRCKETSETCYSWAKSGVGCYNGRGKIVGEFVCDCITDFWADTTFKDRDPFYMPCGYAKKATCLTNEQFVEYGKGAPLYGLHISDLKIYDKPKELSEFKHEQKCFYSKKRCIGKPCEYKPDCLIYTNVRVPQSWCYVEEV